MVNAISNLTGRNPSPLHADAPERRADVQALRRRASAPPDDRVELSPRAHGDARDGVVERAPRGDLIERVRRAIAEGSYVTPDKLDRTIARLYEVLRAPAE